MAEKVLNSNDLANLAMKADELLLIHDHQNLKVLLESFLKENYIFHDLAHEARFYYILGNCSHELFSYRKMDWFSDELSKAVIFFRTALNAIRKIKTPTNDDLHLRSCIETNLGNNLSSQGRVFCCIPLWDNALKHKQNAVPIVSKATNELFLANQVYDPGHRNYHYFTAYQLINKGLDRLDQLYPEQKNAYSAGSYLLDFKAWFEDTYKLEDFDHYETFKERSESRKQSDYLKWCGENRLFINDLNDVCMSEIVYKDIMGLPSFSQQINEALSMYEELMYHGNFDELKNEYCYARYLIFSAENIPNGTEHFFNKTYPHVEDMANTITNIKASQYKSAFRILYSLFDKIAYFISRFFALNEIDYDNRINFERLFRKKNSEKKWQPHPKLKDSKNCFIHALFYILKDIRDVDDFSSVSHCLDPEAKAFSEIRNALEHRSLKIVDDFGYELAQSDAAYRLLQLEKLNNELQNIKVRLDNLKREIRLSKKNNNFLLVTDLKNKEEGLSQDYQRIESKITEKKKLSTHSMLIKESEFKARLMTLMQLARNSIMYLSLAINLEEQSKPDDGALQFPVYVPLK